MGTNFSNNSCCPLPQHQGPSVLVPGCRRPPQLQTSLPHLSGRHAWCAPSSPIGPSFSRSHQGLNARSTHSRSALRSFIQQQEGPFYAASSCPPSSFPGPLPSALSSTAPTSPHAASHSLLTKRIKLCTTSQELAAVLDEYGTHFNTINVAAVLVQLAQLPPGPQPPPPGSNSATDAQAWDAYASYEALLQRVLQQVAGLVPSLGARQVANVMWAAARLGRRCPDGFHPMCASLLGLLLPQSQVMLPWCTPQELSSSLWAVAVSGISPSDDWLESFLLAFETALPNQVREPRHIATVMWGLARLGVAPDATWLAALKARTQQLLPAFSPRDIAQTMAGYAGLGLGAESGPLNRGAVASMQQQLLQGLQLLMGTGEETQRLRNSRSRVASGQGVTDEAAAKGAKGGSSSHRLAQLRLRHQQRQQTAQQEAHAYQQQGARAQQLSLQQQQAARMGAWQGQLEGLPAAAQSTQQQQQQQQQSLGATGSSGQSRSLQGSEQTTAMRSSDDTQQQQQQQQQQDSFMHKAQDVAEVSGAVSSVPLEADPAGLGPLESWAEQAVSTPRDGGGGAQQSMQGVGLGQPGNAAQQHSSSGISSNCSNGSNIGLAGSEEGAHALAMALWSLAIMGWVPPLAWMEETFALVLDNLPAFNSTSLSTVLWAAVTLGQRVPLNLMHAMYGATTATLHAFPPRSLASLVWAVSVADQAHNSSSSSALARPMQPPTQWAEALLSSVHTNLPAYCGQSLSLVLVALARLGITPPQSWAARVVGHLTGPLAPGLGPQALSNSMWALAKMGFSLNKEGTQAFLRLLCARLPSPATSSQPPSPASFNGATSQTHAPASPAHHLDGYTPAAHVAGDVSTPTTCSPNPAHAAYPLNAQELSNVLYALARFEHTPSQDLMESLLGSLRLCLGSPPSSATDATVQTHSKQSTSAANAAAAAAAQAPHLQQPSVQQEMSGAPADATAAAASPQAEESGESAGGYKRLDSSSSSSSSMRRSADRVLNTQELSNVLWALAKLGVQPSETWMADFWVAVQQQIRSFNAKDLSQLVYALAKLGRTPPSHPASPVHATPPNLMLDANGIGFQGEGPHAHEPTQAPSISTPGYVHSVHSSNILTSQGTSATTQNAFSAPLMDSTAPAEAAQLSYPYFHPRGLHPHGVSGAWNDAVSEQRDKGEPHAWAHALLREAAATFSRCSGQDLANLGWGLAQLGVMPSAEWCGQLAGALQARTEVFQGSHLAVCLWALGRMGYKPLPQSLLPTEGALYRRMPSMSARELAACVWAFNTMGYMPDVEWLEGFAQRCMEVAPSFTQQEWAVVVSSLAHIVGGRAELGVYLEDLVIMPQLEARIPEFGPAGLAMLAYACGQLGGHAGRVMVQLLAAATPQLATFSGPELSALITSCARLGQVPNKTFLRAWMAEVAGRLQAQAPPLYAAAAADAEAARRNSTSGDSCSSGSSDSPSDSSGDGGASGSYGSKAGGSSVGVVAGPGKGFGLAAQQQQQQQRQCSHAASVSMHASNGPLQCTPGAHNSLAPLEQQSAQPALSSALAAVPETQQQQEQQQEQQHEHQNLHQQEQRQQQQEPLSGSVLSCFGWALAKLQLRPKQSWCMLYHGALLGQLHSLSPQELAMAIGALTQWGTQVDMDLYKGLVDRARVHRVHYDAGEREAIKEYLVVLRELARPPRKNKVAEM